MDEIKIWFLVFVKIVIMLLIWKKNFCLIINCIIIFFVVGSWWKFGDYDGGRVMGCVWWNRDGGWVFEIGVVLEGLDG